MPSCTCHTLASVCLHEQMCVCLLNECCLLSHVALIIPSWQQLNWYNVSERVLARADVCMLAKWMLSVVPSSPDYSILTAIKLIHEHANGPTRHVVCFQVCVCGPMLNECCLLFHLALMMDLCVFSYMHAFVHSSYVSERVLARADVCMFAKWMLSVVPSSPDYSILTAIKLIHEHANGPTRHVVCF